MAFVGASRFSILLMNVWSRGSGLGSGLGFHGLTVQGQSFFEGRGLRSASQVMRPGVPPLHVVDAKCTCCRK